MIADVVSYERRGMAIGVQTTFVYAGLTFGPAIGGILNDLTGWRGLFFIIVPIALASIVLLAMFRHEIAPDSGDSFDFKWADHCGPLEDPMFLQGDAAPNRRFNYRFIWKR